MTIYGPTTFNLVKQLDSTEIHTYPFPHLVIPNFLPSNIYEELATYFDNPYLRDQIAIDPNCSNQLFLTSVFDGHLQAHLAQSVSAEALESLLFFGTQTFLDIILTRFNISPTVLAAGCALESDLPSFQTLPLAYCPRQSLSFTPTNKTFDPTVYYDIQFGINTPTFGPASSVRDIHIDHPAKLFNALLYFRQSADNFAGGDLCLFRHRGKRRFYNENVLPSDAVLSKVVPYAPNTLALFINSIDSLHGVVERFSTTTERRYINILARCRHSFIDIPSFQGSRLRYSYIKDRFTRLLHSALSS